MPAAAENWTVEDTYRESFYLILTVTDWKQTLDFSRDTTVHETNIFLGEHPSDSRINTLIPLSMLAHYYIATLLPTEYRHAWQYAFIGIEANAVAINANINFAIHF